MNSFLTEDILKLLIAAGLGALIGVEREYHSKSAGLRTMILIAVGSTLFTIISAKLGGDAGRIAANIVTGIGLFSAIFDNVPLVAAIQGMYDLQQYPSGDFFWNYLAYCAGTGGSILIIGSAAGVAAMGMENISFFWYLKNISLAALLGFLGGAFLTILLA